MKNDLEPMYKDRRSLRSMFRPEKAGKVELEGSAPSSARNTADLRGASWESPGDVGAWEPKSWQSPLSGISNSTGEAGSPQMHQGEGVQPVELPTSDGMPMQGNRPLSELPERSRSEKRY